MRLDAEIRQNRPSRMGSSPSPLKKKSSTARRSKSGGENVDPNLPIDPSRLPFAAKTISAKPEIKEQTGVRSEVLQAASASTSDSSVKVVARIRPVSDHERKEGFIVNKISTNSLSVRDRVFTFDSVLDSKHNQEDVFQLVGIPLVKHSLAGFNTSILSYGQTGSGKTYTMWGPPSAMVESYCSDGCQGIVPRIFNMLFSEIQKEKENCEVKLANYQCRCSFLEIYNEQISDLLDPMQRNLQIRDDSKNGFNIENLTEEYVSDLDGVIQILIKGLSNRKVGSTSINTKSSRSHIVFTCVVESWCKGISSQCISSSKSSRMSFIDLAGSERTKLDEEGRECLKDARNVNRSLARLGNLVNVLTEASHLDNSQHLPYKSSCLTNLLREALGGNSKLTVICAISPTSKCEGETFSTLRFGQKARSIQNKAVVNEITEDDVNDLSDQIRLLKEELISVKSNERSVETNYTGNYRGHRARESLNQLRVSLNRSLILPRIEHTNMEDGANLDEEDMQELCVQLASLNEENVDGALEDRKDSQTIPAGGLGVVGCLLLQTENSSNKPPAKVSTFEELSIPANSNETSLLLEEPVQCESPKIQGNSTKNPTTSLARSSLKSSSDFAMQSVKPSDPIRSSLNSRSMLSGPTESLAASLHRGLQIIDFHQNNLCLKTESDEPVSCHSVGKVEDGSLGKSGSVVQCTSCKQNASDGTNQVEESLNTWIVPVEKAETNAGGSNNRKLEVDYAEALERLKGLEVLCAAQLTEIELLTRQIDQYKDAAKNPSGKQHEAAKTTLETVADGMTRTHELKAEEQAAVTDDKKTSFDAIEREELLGEIERLKFQLQSQKDASVDVTTQSTKIARISNTTEDELEKERERWTETESRWISLTEELRLDLESKRWHSEKMEHELRSEKQNSAELADALQRSILGHSNIVEHYTELQENYNDLHWKHRKIMEGIADVKRAAAKVGTKSKHAVFMESLAAELSSLRVEKEKERDYLKKENRGLRIQLRDTAEAVHAAGELLVRLREAEEAASLAEGNYQNERQEVEKMKKQIEKLKRKHAMEIATMKNYLAESRLPESALKPIYENNESTETRKYEYTDDQDWRSEFGPSYRQAY